VYLC